MVLSNFTFVPSLFEQTPSTDEKFIKHWLYQHFLNKLLIEAFLENENKLSVSRWNAKSETRYLTEVPH